MTLHVFANIVTSYGTAANNRAESEGNIVTLQKLIWQGQPHSTVSAESIRFALRRRLASQEPNGTNRNWNEDKRTNTWQEAKFEGWEEPEGKTFIDDDLLGFMTADAANEEGAAGSANVRRGVLEVSRAVSLTPWTGDVTFNVASRGATASASKGDNKSKNPVPYGTEFHATRYQYGIALTPERLRDKSRAAKAIIALCQLGTVAGNQSRFLFDFSPEMIVFRLTDDPSPRLLYCFETVDDGRTIQASPLFNRIESGDIKPEELIVGLSDLKSPIAKEFKKQNVPTSGVKAAALETVKRIQDRLGIKE